VCSGKAIALHPGVAREQLIWDAPMPTTAASLRAGVPTVIVPHLGDQPFWGQRVHALGAGPKPISRNKLTASGLAAAIRAAAADHNMKRRAEDLGEKIRAEDGVGQAVEVIERYLRL